MSADYFICDALAGLSRAAVLFGTAAAWMAPVRSTTMDTNTLLIIVLVVILLGGGGFYFRGRR